MFLVSRYSRALHESITTKVDDQKRFNRLNNKFHLFFKTSVIAGILLSLTQLISVMLFNFDLIKVNSLLYIDFKYIFFVVFQVLSFVIICSLLLLSLLYFRFKPDYRHNFLQQIMKSLVFIIYIFNALLFVVYLSLLKDIAVPELFNYNPFSNDKVLLEIQWYLYLPLIIVSVFYSWAYRKFSHKRTNVTSRIYLLLYLLITILIVVISINSGIKYFQIFDFTIYKQKLFHYTSAYSGLFWVYLMALSFCSIIFSIFIFHKKDKFIGGQFAVSYTLKLASINFYSTQILFILTLAPWLMLEYFKHF
ncbi:MAG: hypothetical protein H6627_01520 [Calditrichae bacterium]|nr:hypothetical protein [Calditrichota bacterium]MCB9057215.1 hypothetical protein [Calditrichia bacterium]